MFFSQEEQDEMEETLQKEEGKDEVTIGENFLQKLVRLDQEQKDEILKFSIKMKEEASSNTRMDQ